LTLRAHRTAADVASDNDDDIIVLDLSCPKNDTDQLKRELNILTFHYITSESGHRMAWLATWLLSGEINYLSNIDKYVVYFGSYVVDINSIVLSGRPDGVRPYFVTVICLWTLNL